MYGIPTSQTQVMQKVADKFKIPSELLDFIKEYCFYGVKSFNKYLSYILFNSVIFRPTSPLVINMGILPSHNWDYGDILCSEFWKFRVVDHEKTVYLEAMNCRKCGNYICSGVVRSNKTTCICYWSFNNNGNVVHFYEEMYYI